MNIKKILNSRIFVIVGIVAAIVVISTIIFSNGNGDYETLIVERSDLIEKTEVSGKVVPGEEINLSFQTTGRISSMSVNIGDVVKRGQVLARLDSNEINSEINESVADLRSEEARLAEIVGSPDGQSQLDSVRSSLISVLKKAYITADGIVKNTVDTFITDPQTITPEFDQSLADYFLRGDIEDKRVVIEDVLLNWKNAINTYTADSISISDASSAIDNLKEIEDLLFTISLGADDFEVNSTKTQSQIDAYINSINSARTTVAGLIVEINSETEAVRKVQAEIPILQASINGANATISRLSAKSNNYIIIAPFDGLVTDDPGEVGQVVSSGETVLSLVSDAAFEVESFVPEVSVAGVDVGDRAELVFDAFGPDQIYEAFLIHIDPRETIKDGVTTYRILLGFNEDHSEILSGMNTEIVIEKEKILNQIVIPRYYVQIEDGNSVVEKRMVDGSLQKVSVVLGKKDNSGNIIVESGLSEGDEIVAPHE